MFVFITIKSPINAWITPHIYYTHFWFALYICMYFELFFFCNVYWFPVRWFNAMWYLFIYFRL